MPDKKAPVVFYSWQSDLPALLKPIFDKIWRSAGFDRCWYFDEQGNYLRR